VPANGCCDSPETALAHVIGDKAEQAYRRSDARGTAKQISEQRQRLLGKLQIGSDADIADAAKRLAGGTKRSSR